VFLFAPDVTSLNLEAEISGWKVHSWKSSSSFLVKSGGPLATQNLLNL